MDCTYLEHTSHPLSHLGRTSLGHFPLNYDRHMQAYLSFFQNHLDTCSALLTRAGRIKWWPMQDSNGAYLIHRLASFKASFSLFLDYPAPAYAVYKSSSSHKLRMSPRYSATLSEGWVPVPCRSLRFLLSSTPSQQRRWRFDTCYRRHTSVASFELPGRDTLRSPRILLQFR